MSDPKQQEETCRNLQSNNTLKQSNSCGFRAAKITGLWCVQKWCCATPVLKINDLAATISLPGKRKLKDTGGLTHSFIGFSSQWYAPVGHRYAMREYELFLKAFGFTRWNVENPAKPCCNMVITENIKCNISHSSHFHLGDWFINWNWQIAP